jgi:hypothetical protein
MLAISTWGLVAAWSWIGGLVLALVGQAVWVWFKFHMAERSAAHARRLLDETEQASASSPRPAAQVLPFRSKAVPTSAGRSERAQP